MGRQDQYCIGILILLIVIHVAVLITGALSNRLLYLTSILNLAACLSIAVYWLQKQLVIEQHIFDLNEIIVLCFEVIVIGCTVYTMVSREPYYLLKLIQYIVFGIHLSALCFLLVFMLTFKMNRLM